MSDTNVKTVWASAPAAQVPTEAGTLTRRFVHGEQLTVAYFTFAPDTILPVHSHVNEQFSTVLRGRLRFMVGDETVEAGIGETVHLPPGVPHGAVALEETDVLDVFAPPRADW